MAQVTFSAVPINGGALSLNSENGHVCRLSGSRYLSICSQYTPQYTLGNVVTLNNAKSTTPSVTVLRQQVITGLLIGNQNGNNSARMIRLTDNSVLVLKADSTNFYVKNMNVLYVDPTTNEITTKLASDVTLFTQANAWGFNSSGVTITGITEADNSVIIAYRTTLAQAKVVRVVYDPNANTLTTTDISTISVHTSATSVSSLGLTKSPNGVVLFSAVGTSSNRIDLMGITKLFFIGTGSNTATTLLDEAYTASSIQNRRKWYVPLTDTTGIFTDGMYMQALTNGVLGQSVTITNAIGPGVYLHCSHALKMSDEYFATLTVYFGGSVGTDNLTNVSRGFRVVKYTDPNYSICSPATVGVSTQAGVTVPSANYWFPELPMLDLVDSQLMTIPIIASPTSFGFRTLWVS